MINQIISNNRRDRLWRLIVFVMTADVVLWFGFRATELMDFPALDLLLPALVAAGAGGTGVVQALGWLAAFLIAVRYVPELVHPKDPDRPASTLARVTLAVPPIYAGLLAETVFRQLVASAVEPLIEVSSFPVTPFTVGGVAALTLISFGEIRRRNDTELSFRQEYSLPGYFARALVLVAVLGIFFAEFVLLTPFSELFALALFTLALLNLFDTEIPDDPVERLAEGAATVWQGSALTVLTVYAAGVLASVGLVLLAVRVRTPADMLGRAPLSTAFLIVIAVGAGGYTYLYCERMLRQLRPGYDPETEPTGNVEAGLIPAAILVSLLLHLYVFGDPLEGPGVVEVTIGLLTVVSTAVGAGSPWPWWRQFGPRDTKELGGETSVSGVSVKKTVNEVQDGITVTVALQSEDTCDVRFQEQLSWWVPLESIYIDDPKSWYEVSDGLKMPFVSDGEWNWTDEQPRRLWYETTLSADEIQKIRYWCPLPDDKYADDVFHETTIVTEPDGKMRDVDVVDDIGMRGANIGDAPILPNIPLYYQPTVEIGLFCALLVAIEPLRGVYVLTAVMDGTILTILGPEIVTTLTRFGWALVTPLLLFLPFGLVTQRVESERIARELGARSFEEPGSLLDVLTSTDVRVLLIAAIVAWYHFRRSGPLVDVTWEIVTLLISLLVAFGGVVNLLRTYQTLSSLLFESLYRGGFHLVFFPIAVPIAIGYYAYEGITGT